jgi:hypothetical protein
VLGCTDLNAPNYDATANVDDGSCNFYCNENTTTIEVYATQGWGTQYGVGVGYTITELATGIDYSNLPAAGYWWSDWDSLCLPTGCYEVAVDGGTGGYPLEIYVNSAPGTMLTGEMFGVGTAYLSVDGAICIAGCTDQAANNYDANATIDDGSCIICPADNVVSMNMIDAYGDGWNGATYDISDDQGTSVASGGLLGGSAASDLACLPTGCYDITVGGGSYDSEISWNLTDWLTGNVLASGAAPSTTTLVSVGGASCEVLGCTDPLAANYNVSATLDDNSCCYDNIVSMLFVNDGLFNPWHSEVSWTLSDDAANVVAAGGAPYSATECLPDGCYTFEMLDVYADGWNDGGAMEFSANGAVFASEGLASGGAGSALIEVGSGICDVLGCTDDTASNYDPAATLDDNSCVYPCLLDVVTLSLSDSWGDGWDSGASTLTIAGVDYTLADGYGPELTTLC